MHADKPVYRVGKWRKTLETTDSQRYRSLPRVSVPTEFVSSGHAKMIEEQLTLTGGAHIVCRKGIPLNADKPVYRVAKWRETFETADSRRFRSLPWVSVPTDFVSNGYAKMIEEFGDQAPEIFGAWIALVKIAATCPERGLLSTSSGVGLSVGRLSFLSHFPSSVFEKLLAWASSNEIAWLEILTVEQAKKSIAGQQTTATRVAVVLPNLTTPNLTLPNDTQPDQTEPVVGRQVVGREFNFLWTGVELEQEGKRFRRISLCSRANLPSEALGRLLGFGLSVGGNFLGDLATTMREKEIKHPAKYVEASMRNFCKERQIDLIEIGALVEKRFAELKISLAGKQ